jgi:hypothetical protein
VVDPDRLISLAKQVVGIARGLGIETARSNAVARAEMIDASSGLRCARLDDLVALKLDAGSRKDLADIVEVLARNRDADLDQIRATCEPYDRAGVLETLIAEASAERR